MTYPKISIVTPSFNQGKYLEQTILSIIGQKYPNLEYIVIDGGSTDESLGIIKKYEKKFSYWVSEKDKGQSDAINKGLQHCSGELFNWINSDDLLEDGALFTVAAAYSKNPEKKVFCFGLTYLKDGKKQLFSQRNDPANKLQCFCDPVISQPATFIATDAVKKSGGINPLVHYSMDYELWLKLIFRFGNESVLVNDPVIASFRVHNEAKTSGGDENFVNDMATVLFSLCKQAKLPAYCDLIESVFKIDKHYHLIIPKEKTDPSLIKRMTHFFLLKWRRNIFTKNDFISAKKIVNEIKFDPKELSAKEKIWLEEMKINTKPSSWLEFRAKRKIRHLLSR